MQRGRTVLSVCRQGKPGMVCVWFILKFRQSILINVVPCSNWALKWNPVVTASSPSIFHLHGNETNKSCIAFIHLFFFDTENVSRSFVIKIDRSCRQCHSAELHLNGQMKYEINDRMNYGWLARFSMTGWLNDRDFTAFPSHSINETIHWFGIRCAFLCHQWNRYASDTFQWDRCWIALKNLSRPPSHTEFFVHYRISYDVIMCRIDFEAAQKTCAVCRCTQNEFQICIMEYTRSKRRKCKKKKRKKKTKDARHKFIRTYDNLFIDDDERLCV